VNQHTGRNFTVDDSEAAKKKFAEEFNFEENLKKLAHILPPANPQDLTYTPWANVKRMFTWPSSPSRLRGMTRWLRP